MSKFQERYDELTKTLNISKDKLSELKDKLKIKEEELTELENDVFNKQVDVKKEKEIRDDMINSKTKKLDNWTFGISMISLFLITINLYRYVFVPYIVNGLFLKITNEFLSLLVFVGVSTASFISFVTLFFVVFGVSVSLKNAIAKRMINKIKKSQTYIKQNEKVLLLEQELKDARHKKSSVKAEYDDLSINISYEEIVCRDVQGLIENLKNEIVCTVITDKNSANIEHKNKTKVRSKKEEKK